MKLSTRLLLLFLAISIIPLCATGYLAYVNGIDTIKQNTFDRLVSTNILKAAQVTRWINASRTHLQALAQRPLVRKYAAQLTEGDLSQPLESIREILIVDHFKPSISYNSGFIDISLLGAQSGQIIASSEPKLAGKFRTNRPFFIHGKQATYVDQMTFEVGLEKLVMHVTTPVKDERNQTVAVLSGHLDWEELSLIMAQGSEHSRSEESYLVNQFNYFVTDSRFIEGYQLEKTIHTEGVQRCLAKQDGVELYEDYRPIPIIGAFRWMEQWKLCILTEIDQAEAFQPVVDFRMVFITIGLGAAAFAAIFSLLLARTITNRIDRLVIGAKEIGDGNFECTIETSGKDELDQLAHSFNTMAKALKTSEEMIQKAYGELEDRVIERTAEISNKNRLLVEEIRERILAETALRESEDKYRALVENLHIAVVVHAANTSIIMSNHRAQELLQLTKEQMAGKTAIDPAWHFCHEDGSIIPVAEYPVNIVLDTQKPLNNYTLGINSPNSDETIWATVNAFPEFDVHNQLLQVVVTFWDMTFHKEAETKLQDSLHEKEVLLREVHHRVKNNMQMIQSLINLQARKVDNPEYRQVLADSKSRIKSMSLIHETLYRSENIANLDLKKYFQQLSRHLIKLYRKTTIRINIKYDIEPIILNMDSSIACGLIVNELITNALKYAFEGQKENNLMISLHNIDSEKQAELTVTDDGIGLPDGFDRLASQSLGLKIVQMLAVDQLRGTIETETSPGTKFIIRFPL